MRAILSTALMELRNSLSVISLNPPMVRGPRQIGPVALSSRYNSWKRWPFVSEWARPIEGRQPPILEMVSTLSLRPSRQCASAKPPTETNASFGPMPVWTAVKQLGQKYW
jgi:hypothetical protein